MHIVPNIFLFLNIFVYLHKVWYVDLHVLTNLIRK